MMNNLKFTKKVGADGYLENTQEKKDIAALFKEKYGNIVINQTKIKVHLKEDDSEIE